VHLVGNILLSHVEAIDWIKLNPNGASCW
jgi:hypothetical protein